MLFKELARISTPFHTAIDNYYKIAGIALAALGAATAIIAAKEVEILLGVVPFLVLCTVMLEAQIRNTILCAGKYMAIMEARINREAGFKALLYEQRLTFGKALYHNMWGLLLNRVPGILAFLVVSGAIFAFGYDRFVDHLNEPRVHVPLSLDAAKVIVGYKWTLGIVAIGCAYAWLNSFHFPFVRYPKLLESAMKDEGMDSDQSKPDGAPSTLGMGSEHAIVNGSENARCGYQAAITLMTYEGGLIWSKFNAMLVANSIVLGIIGMGLSSEFAPKWLPLALSSCGLLLCLCWHFLMARSWDYYKYWILSARELEEQFLSPVMTLSRGGEIADGKTVQLTISKLPKKMSFGMANAKAKDVSNWVILAFAVLYLVFFIVGLYLQFCPLAS